MPRQLVEASRPPNPTQEERPLTSKQLETLRRQVAEASTWQEGVLTSIATAKQSCRWFSQEQRVDLESTRPDPSLLQILEKHNVIGSLTPKEIAAVRFLKTDLGSLITGANRQILQREMTSRSSFFQTIERSPLTPEQIRSVICFDNRVHVLAAAGSGKTSVMVARAAYAVSRGFMDPKQILLLAFNREAASELRERVSERFTAAGIPFSDVRVSTFHAFGLEVIGHATGSKPRLAPWMDGGREVSKILEIVDGIRKNDPQFRLNWDLYRLIFAAAPLEPDEAKPDAYDSITNKTGFGTIRGEIVKSYGERMIADWLFLNGVQYEYEQPYCVDLSDATHSQYRPDFYYPQIDIWHEHWGLDAKGKPPKSFAGYEDAIRWKKAVHLRHQTTLIETTFHAVVNGSGLPDLGAQLTAKGISLHWDPNRKVDKPRRLTSDEQMAQLMRRFMAHVKSNSLTRDDLEARLGKEFQHLSGTRVNLFLSLYWKIHEEWERQLHADGLVDFEDMLLAAAHHLETGKYAPGYQLVLVDEFQDASQTRARLLRSLLKEKGRYLLAVGDDWQSINAFAGSDLSVLRNFTKWFGDGPQLALTKTFRSTQVISDVASAFIQKNPGQLRKKVLSTKPERGRRVTVVMCGEAKDGVSAILENLSNRSRQGKFPSRDGSRPSVFVLGRYRHNIDDVPKVLPEGLDVSFHTIHTSKGLEADLVIITGVTAGRSGFPSEVGDDPILNLAMAEPDSFPDAEERRLFYVALTRARSQVAIISQANTPSRFVTELIEDKAVDLFDTNLKPLKESTPCSGCRQGVMVRRDGINGSFLGCSTFPECRKTMPIPSEQPNA